jgi:hypothetical protein
MRAFFFVALAPCKLGYFLIIYLSSWAGKRNETFKESVVVRGELDVKDEVL